MLADVRCAGQRPRRPLRSPLPRRLPARSLVADSTPSSGAAALNVAGVLIVDSRRPDRVVVVLVISPVRALVAGCGLLLLHTVNHDDAVGTAKIGDILLSMEETDVPAPHFLTTWVHCWCCRPRVGTFRWLTTKKNQLG